MPAFLHRDRLRQLLDAHGVDLLIATASENILYASGYMPFQGIWNRFAKAAVVSRHEEGVHLVLPLNEVGFAEPLRSEDGIHFHFFGRSNFAAPQAAGSAAEAWMEARAGEAASDIVTLLETICADATATGARIVVDQGGAADLAERLAARLEQRRLLGGGEEFWRLVRMVKTPAEVDLLRRAISVNESGIAAAFAHLGRTTEAEVERIFQAAVGAAGGHVQHWMGAAGREAGAYRRPTATVSPAGSRFRYDCGVWFEGYCSDLGGTAQIGGEPTRREREVYRALTAGIEAALERARPGVLPSLLYEEILAAVRRAGLPEYRYSLVGHGIGVEPRDYPLIAPPARTASRFLGETFDPPLEAGMVLNIECPIIGLADGGYQHEVTLLVEADGARLLSRRREYEVV